MTGSQNRLQNGRNGSEVYQRVPNFGTNDNTKYIKACTLEAERLKIREKRGDYRKLLFWLILEG